MVWLIKSRGIVKLLIRNGSDVNYANSNVINVIDEYGRVLLVWASHHGHYDIEALRACQRDHYDKSDLRRVGECLWRCQDDDGPIGQTKPSLPHRRNRQRVLSVPAQLRNGQDAHQGS